MKRYKVCNRRVEEIFTHVLLAIAPVSHRRFLVSRSIRKPKIPWSRDVRSSSCSDFGASEITGRARDAHGYRNRFPFRSERARCFLPRSNEKPNEPRGRPSREPDLRPETNTRRANTCGVTFERGASDATTLVPAGGSSFAVRTWCNAVRMTRRQEERDEGVRITRTPPRSLNISNAIRRFIIFFIFFGRGLIEGMGRAGVGRAARRRRA